ncbi:class D sortase [Romboutsia sp.]|uniref:class D sortase n=1 Tax=Romboutsia sp. TaxID=1965302 RepID=UPI003F2ED2FE
MKKIIGKILIIIGIIIITVPTYLNYTTKKSNDQVVQKYEKVINSNQQDKTNSKTQLPEDIIGILEIPKINLKVAIQEGTDKTTLKTAVGHFKNTAMPGRVGNFAVAGHRTYTSNKFFSNLDKMEEKDEIKVVTKTGTFTYRVTSTEVVPPEKVEVLNPKNNKKIITLITCTPKYVGSHRLVIQGELK